MSQSATADAPPVAPAKPRRQSKPKSSTPPRKLPPFNVVLLDDNDHTYAYVVAMLEKLFGHSREKAYQLTKQVDTAGRAILLTTTKEHAELKRDQIHAFGPDQRIQACSGSMSAIIEPAG
jgi:ATP-dependent Clp protease adaptor protein ClpS